MNSCFEGLLPWQVFSIVILKQITLFPFSFLRSIIQTMEVVLPLKFPRQPGSIAGGRREISVEILVTSSASR